MTRTGFSLFLNSIAAGRIPIYHDIQVTSYGGSGVTFLLDFLSSCKNMNCNQDRGGSHFRHMKAPPATPLNANYIVGPKFRAIYIFGNPINAILSFFRRFPIENCAKSLSSRYINEIVPGWGLEKYLDACIEKDKDLLQLEDHFNNWAFSDKKQRTYPIMLVNYENMWKNLSEIFTFINLPLNEIERFPIHRDRQSTIKSQPSFIQNKLYKVYGEFCNKINKFNEIAII